MNSNLEIFYFQLLVFNFRIFIYLLFINYNHLFSCALPDMSSISLTIVIIMTWRFLSGHTNHWESSIGLFLLSTFKLCNKLFSLFCIWQSFHWQVKLWSHVGDRNNDNFSKGLSFSPSDCWQITIVLLRFVCKHGRKGSFRVCSHIHTFSSLLEEVSHWS